MKLDELKKIIKRFVFEAKKKSDPDRYSLSIGWGVKGVEHPDVPWAQTGADKDDRLHDDPIVFKKFMGDILGFDPSKKQKASKETGNVAMNLYESEND